MTKKNFTLISNSNETESPRRCSSSLHKLHNEIKPKKMKKIKISADVNNETTS